MFDLPKKRIRLEELEREAASPDFWNDQEAAQKTLQERSRLTDLVEAIEKLHLNAENAGTGLELFAESSEAELLADAANELDLLEQGLSKLEIARMMSGKHDVSDAVVEINSGAGGTEAQDWCEMLLRMYLRWAEKQGFKTEILSINAGEEAGLKNVTFSLRGENAFGYIKAERGVHRLVRISPFDSNARRHTSFASVGAIPEIEEDIDIEINEDDLRIDTYRSSGAGGQHVNKTDSAVRITHFPSGIVIACQTDRSQHKNKARAMKLLKAKLYDLELEKKREEANALAGERKKIDFGSQIRSYVMQPYQMVKDLRTSIETSDVQGVLDGDLDKFIEGYLLSDAFVQDVE
ncbi:MAG: peptide chain release factor 2 [Bdellovibrionales bacterium]|nr:peptide chain release factor 2 [Bdellovibrionales bacterium]